MSNDIHLAQKRALFNAGGGMEYYLLCRLTEDPHGNLIRFGAMTGQDWEVCQYVEQLIAPMCDGSIPMGALIVHDWVRDGGRRTRIVPCDILPEDDAPLVIGPGCREPHQWRGDLPYPDHPRLTTYWRAVSEVAAPGDLLVMHNVAPRHYLIFRFDGVQSFGLSAGNQHPARVVYRLPAPRSGMISP